MTTLKEFRKIGREKMTGKWGKAILPTLILFLISICCSSVIQLSGQGSQAFTSFAPLISWLIIAPISWAFIVLFLRNFRGDAESFDVSHLFDGFKDYKRITFTIILMYIYVILWTLLLIVPGIIKSISYAMTPFILEDHPEMKNNEAIELSMKMMKGNKMRYFLLTLSFIGWILLGMITFCIGYLWIIPYMNSTYAGFYENLKSESAE